MGLNVQVGEKYNLVYLHHQWSDEAHTLQFCSTGEYFETPEYELQSPLGDGAGLRYCQFELLAHHYSQVPVQTDFPYFFSFGDTLAM